MKNRRNLPKPVTAKPGAFYRMNAGFPPVVRVTELWGRGRNRGVTFVDMNAPAGSPPLKARFADFNKGIKDEPPSAKAIADKVVAELS